MAVDSSMDVITPPGLQIEGMQSIWTFLLEYSVVQGLLLAILLGKRYRYFYLSFLLLAVSYLIFHFLYEHFGWQMKNPAILWTNVPFWFTIGPLYYLHGQSLYRESPQYQWKDLLHLIPALGVFLYLSPFYFGKSPEEKLTDYLTMFGQDYQFDFVQVAYVLQMLIYGYLGLTHSRRKFDLLNREKSDSDQIYLGLQTNIYWALICYAVLAMLMAIVLLLFQDRYQDLLFNYIFVFLALAIVVHASTYFVLVYQKPRELNHTLPPKLNAKKNGKYASSSLDPENIKALLVQIQQTLTEKELYKNANLRISDLAEEINVPSHHISQCLNQELGKNFFDFINEYRVEAVKENLLKPDNQNYTLFAIANGCGFNSHTSFYRIFKKTTGMTPKQYIEQSKSINS